MDSRLASSANTGSRVGTRACDVAAESPAGPADASFAGGPRGAASRPRRRNAPPPPADAAPPSPSHPQPAVPRSLALAPHTSCHPLTPGAPPEGDDGAGGCSPLDALCRVEWGAACRLGRALGGPRGALPLRLSCAAGRRLADGALAAPPDGRMHMRCGGVGLPPLPLPAAAAMGEDGAAGARAAAFGVEGYERWAAMLPAFLAAARRAGEVMAAAAGGSSDGGDEAGGGGGLTLSIALEVDVTAPGLSRLWSPILGAAAAAATARTDPEGCAASGAGSSSSSSRRAPAGPLPHVRRLELCVTGSAELLAARAAAVEREVAQRLTGGLQRPPSGGAAAGGSEAEAGAAERRLRALARARHLAGHECARRLRGMAAAAPFTPELAAALAALFPGLTELALRGRWAWGLADSDNDPDGGLAAALGLGPDSAHSELALEMAPGGYDISGVATTEDDVTALSLSARQLLATGLPRFATALPGLRKLSLAAGSVEAGGGGGAEDEETWAASCQGQLLPVLRALTGLQAPLLALVLRRGDGSELRLDMRRQDPLPPPPAEPLLLGLQPPLPPPPLAPLQPQRVATLQVINGTCTASAEGGRTAADTGVGGGGSGGGNVHQTPLFLTGPLMRLAVRLAAAFPCLRVLRLGSLSLSEDGSEGWLAVDAVTSLGAEMPQVEVEVVEALPSCEAGLLRSALGRWVKPNSLVLRPWEPGPSPHAGSSERGGGGGSGAAPEGGTGTCGGRGGSSEGDGEADGEGAALIISRVEGWLADLISLPPERLPRLMAFVRESMSERMTFLWLGKSQGCQPQVHRGRTACQVTTLSASTSTPTHAAGFSVPSQRARGGRSEHPGPLATFQGTAQLTGLLKERSQDYFLAHDRIPLSVEDLDLCFERGSVEDAGAAAGCSTSNSGGVRVTAGLPSLLLTGVFDGHGGETSARFAHEAILSLIASDKALHQSLGAADVDSTAAALKAAYNKVDGELLALAAASASAPAEPSPDVSPLASDESSTLGRGGRSEGAKASRGHVPYQDGTTALVTVQLGGLLAVANAGDSRAVLCRSGEAVRLSRDHTPALRSERERIEAAGGQVVVARGAARVVVPLAGSPDVLQALSVSRSLGDPQFKAHGLVTCEPDVSVMTLQPGLDEFLISASDGLWGRVPDQDAVDCVAGVLAEYAHMSAAHRGSAAKAAAKRLLRLAQDAGSVDDVTVVVSVFAWAP
ncbi:hypothetical protein HYH03_016101 [Edaphochlamys debaryana]|uniref:PPM-type phosphatase domain-containing protein n=1 Tax=Edaphochlamys debaryana TaxID=47281 RepID=A0A835XKG0_9CHLO|nr:hypothetical protein HYH03_016101 [Edaphochlamys debaryana]|eukprot:KAG2485114.1 hypothetical protein HYH03_016101 [Edaphochlamys debaryana]